MIYFIGGVTYEESNLVDQLNRDYPGMRFLIGGSFVHNSTSFLEDVLKYAEREGLIDKSNAGLGLHSGESSSLLS
jgi:hypothetical protein